MKFQLSMLLSFALAASLFSCSSPADTKTEQQQQPQTYTAPAPVYDTFEKGKVLNPVFLKGDSSISYALYLPAAYSTEKKFPVIYFFDPHAGGHLPIDKYRELAERYGFVIIGSNSTENGMKMDATNTIVQKTMDDTKNRLALDPARIYTCGFSGGSRVASTYAIAAGGVNSVIACGAGLGTKQSPKQKFAFLGIAGNEDFNYTELKTLDKQLAGTDWTHFFLEFNGKHEWPPVETMEDALVWLQANAMRDQLIPKDDSLIRAFSGKCLKQEKESSSRKDLYGQWMACSKLLAFLPGLLSDSLHSVVSATIAGIEGDKKFKDITDHKSKLEAREDSLRQMYAASLQSRDDAWWNAEVKKLNSEIKTMKDKDEVLIRKRLMSYLSLAAYMSSSGAAKFKDYKAADHFLTIYELVDPENPEHAYLRAVIAAKQGENDKAMEYLKKSAKLGFSDLKRLLSEKELVDLSGKYKEFRDVLETIKANTLKEK